jgi:hypothetical protein
LRTNFWKKDITGGWGGGKLPQKTAKGQGLGQGLHVNSPRGEVRGKALRDVEGAHAHRVQHQLLYDVGKVNQVEECGNKLQQPRAPPSGKMQQTHTTGLAKVGL